MWLCFHVKFGWWVGDSCLDSWGQGRATVVVVESCLPLPATCVACFWRVFGCRETEWPALGGAGGADCTAGQDVMVLPDPCPRRQRLIQECAPHGPLSSFGTKLQVLWTWGPQWHSAVQTSSHCPAPLANTESKMKFSEGPQVTAIDLSRNKAKANASSVPSLWAMAASHTATGFLLRQVCFGRVNSISGALQGSWSKS